jgi:hypothetical protein
MILRHRWIAPAGGLLMIGALILLVAAVWPAPRLSQSLQLEIPETAAGGNPLEISVVWQQPGYLRPGEVGVVDLTVTASQPQAIAPAIVLSASLHSPWLARDQRGTWSQPWRGDLPAAFTWHVTATSDRSVPAQIVLESRKLGDAGSQGEARPVWVKTWTMQSRSLLGLSQAQALWASAGALLVAGLWLAILWRGRVPFPAPGERLGDD